MTILDQNYFDLALLILSSLFVGFIITPASIWFAKKLDIIDYPGRTTHQIHKRPTPRAGGIAIMFSLLIMILWNQLWDQAEILWIFIPAVVIFSFGLWDDKRGMDASAKLVGQLLAVTILVFFDVRVKFMENQSFFIQLNGTLAYWVDIFITYLWMVGITNAFNMVDSMDGLAIGLSQSISAFFLFLSMVSGQASLAYFSAIIFGISLSAAFYNRRPAKMFLGDSGAQSLGFMLAAAAIIYHPKAFSQASSWFSPIMFFSVPIFDTSLVTISRILRGLPFYKANLDHTYHRLVALGWDQNRAVALMQIGGIVFGLMSICVVYLSPFIANMVFVIWMIVFAAMIYLLEKNFSTYDLILKNG